MALTVVVSVCFTLIIALFFLLVLLLRPEDVTLKAKLTNWMSFELGVKSPQSVRESTSAKQQTSSDGGGDLDG